MCKSNNELMRGIHKQVTSFVLKKVAQQISYLESMDELVQNQQHLNQNSFNIQNCSTDTNSMLLNCVSSFNLQQMTNFNSRVNPQQRTNFNPSFNPQ